MRLLFQAQELQIHRILDHLGWRRWNSLLAGHGQYSLLVTAFQQTLIQQRILLPLQLPGCPEILGGLQFIILPFIRVGNADKELILCPIELRPQCGRNLGPISKPNYKVKEKNRMNRHS
jgi:hypothetical protein